MDFTEISQQSNYYPFGLEHKGTDYGQATQTTHKYLFNGQEYQDEFGLQITAMDFRGLDNQTARFMSVDPMASERSWLTPYNFVQNNPITRIDPTGMLDTKYEDEDGNLVVETNDGSDDVVIVPNENLEEFKENVELTPENMRDSKGWNDFQKTELLGFESAEDMEGYLSNSSSQRSRQHKINYLQDKSYGNWALWLLAEVGAQRTDLMNYLPSPIKVKGMPNLKGSPDVKVKAPSVKTPTTSPSTAPSNAMSKNSWIQFNREMGAGRFTKDRFGGSSQKANEARMKAYYQWKANNN